jgi:cystathionine beta-lyase/cystathionine gamma-synthase
MKTLAVRMRCHNHNAQEVAEFLQDHPRVERVHYPGLKDHPQHSLARKLMSGFGGMLSFEVKGGREGAERTMSSTRVIKMATSLGGVESLVSMPLNSSHHALPAKERERLGIRDSLLRLSVGIEDPVDLIEDLDLALRSN